MFARPAPLALAIIAALSASAQAEEQPTLFDDVVVSASRTAELKTSEVAAAMTVVDAEQIADQQANSIARLVRHEPGVEVTGGGRFGLQDFNIRGIDGNRVQIMVDGVSQANAYDSGTEFMRSSRNFVDVETLKQVEITKSPSSALYGSGSIGGTVAFTTKDPADFLSSGDGFGGEAKIAYMSDDNSFAETIALANRNGVWETLLQYTRRDGDELATNGDVGGEGDNRTEADPADNSSDAVLGKIIYNGDAHWVGITAEYFNDSYKSDLLSQNDGNPDDPGVTYANQRADDQTKRVRLSLAHDWQAELTAFDSLSWSLNYQDSQSEQTTSNWYTSSAFPTGVNRQMDRDYGEKSYQLTLDLAKQIDADGLTHHISYGGDVEYTEMENLNTTTYDNGTPPSISRYAPQADQTVYGFYLQDEIKWQQLTVIPALRYDNTKVKPNIDAFYQGGFDSFADHNSDALTFRLGTIYQFTDSISAFAQYAQGFRSPDLKELYYAEDSGRGYALLANPNLEAEESDSYELGLRYNGNLGSAELVVYQNKYDNFIIRTSDYSNPAYPFGELQYNNVDKATIKGIEFKSQLWLDSVAEGLSLDFTVAYSEGDNDTENQPLNSVIPLNGSLGLSYLDSEGRYGANLITSAYAGKDESDIAASTDFMGNPVSNYASGGYAVVDLIAFYNVTEQLVIRGGVFNALDKKYIIWNDVAGLPSGRSYMDRYTQPGRNAGVSINYRF